MTSSGPESSAKRPLLVLVVDDNVDAADSLALLLVRLGGHQARVAYDARTALCMAREFRPDVILLDIGLPQKDGFSVARELRAIPGLEDIVIIAVTGYGRESDRDHSRAAGIDLHMLKPVDVRELLSYLRGDSAAQTADMRQSSDVNS
ncbi:Transcriptional regulatory protein YycF [Anatilimnocola aggregata]|uniref:Transcriptional regulatory protein YycF n=1 Tax=Anatilimnocola aggregata TaxID=2528021 RepID=A0A517Y738_9BACT|nr:response regulator [Anatilimnocola aggregata]QDU26040.1 Transcriptional regulatory protein YycF [Anatilimnocola aggregata]